MTTITTDWLTFANVSQDDTGTAWDRLANFNSQAAPDPNDTSTYSEPTSNIAAGGLTQRVRLWGVTLPPSVPSGATLVGIEVRVWNARGLSPFADDTRRLMDGTTEVGNNLALAGDYQNGFNDATDRISGGASNLWGTSLAKSDLGANFGFRFRAVNTGSKSGLAFAARAAVRFTFEEDTGLTATLAAQETGSDTAAGSLGVVVSGNLSVQEAGQDTASGSLGVSVSASLTAQEAGQDVASGTATVLVSGTLSAQEAGQDTFSATATVGPAPITATLAAQEVGSDTFTGALGVTVSGSLTVQEIGSDTFTATATLGPAPITATLAAQEVGADTAAGLASVLVSGSLSVQEVGADTFSSAAAVALSATLAVQELGSDTFAGMVFIAQPSERRFAFPGQAKNGGQVATQAKSSIISQGRAGVVLSPNNGGEILDHARSGHIVGA